MCFKLYMAAPLMLTSGRGAGQQLRCSSAPCTATGCQCQRVHWTHAAHGAGRLMHCCSEWCRRVECAEDKGDALRAVVQGFAPEVGCTAAAATA